MKQFSLFEATIRSNVSLFACTRSTQGYLDHLTDIYSVLIGLRLLRRILISMSCIISNAWGWSVLVLHVLELHFWNKQPWYIVIAYSSSDLSQDAVLSRNTYSPMANNSSRLRRGVPMYNTPAKAFAYPLFYFFCLRPGRRYCTICNSSTCKVLWSSCERLCNLMPYEYQCCISEAPIQ